jgi:hypothetical protein
MPPKINLPPKVELPKVLGFSFGDVFLVEFEEGDKLCMLVVSDYERASLIDLATGHIVTSGITQETCANTRWDVSLDDFWSGVSRPFEEVQIEINVRRQN